MGIAFDVIKKLNIPALGETGVNYKIIIIRVNKMYRTVNIPHCS